MKKIGISQKVFVNELYNEHLDSLDQNWSDLLLSIDLMPIPLPNIAANYAPDLYQALQLDGLILSGGNSISVNGSKPKGYAPKRDSFEAAFLSCCIRDDLPILGVCRGMQFLNVFFGGELIEVEGHAGSHKHPLIVDENFTEDIFPKEVNTFHDFGISQSVCAPDFEMLAYDTQGNVEAFRHKKYDITGIMWHPERSSPYLDEDIALLKVKF